MKIVIVENPRPASIDHYNDVANAPLSASLNSGYALAVARQAGWETAYLDFTACRDDEATMAAAILAENADIVLVHWVYSWGNEATVSAVLERLKREKCGPAGAFGLFPTLSRGELLRHDPHLDFVIAGEFEQTLAELLRRYAETGRLALLPGVAMRNEPFVASEVIPDPSHLPVPDDVGANAGLTTLNIAASRGCFGDCGFCFINTFYGCNRRRERSITSFGDELETRLQRREVDHLYFVDPTFIGRGPKQRERIAAISAIAKNTGLPFGLETRVDTVDRELCAVLARNGASSIFLGIESGCDPVLKRINKRISRADILRAVRSIRESGIRLTVGFIMFEPDATLDELRENYAFLEELDLLSDHELTVNLLYHSQIVLYGSKGWGRLEREGRLLVDGKLPFEARYRFRDQAVARVCSSMRRLASGYFGRTDSRFRGSGGESEAELGCTGAPNGMPGADVNLLLKEAFRSFTAYADRCGEREYAGLEERFAGEMERLILPLPR